MAYISAWCTKPYKTMIAGACIVNLYDICIPLYGSPNWSGHSGKFYQHDVVSLQGHLSE